MWSPELREPHVSSSLPHPPRTFLLNVYSPFLGLLFFFFFSFFFSCIWYWHYTGRYCWALTCTCRTWYYLTLRHLFFFFFSFPGAYNFSFSFSLSFLPWRQDCTVFLPAHFRVISFICRWRSDNRSFWASSRDPFTTRVHLSPWVSALSADLEFE